MSGGFASIDVSTNIQVSSVGVILVVLTFSHVYVEFKTL